MHYANQTFEDKNPVKRWLQRRRLGDALALVSGSQQPGLIIDFGAGNGELCRVLARRYPSARIVCYEPHPNLREEARQNLSDLPAVEIADSFEALPRYAAELVFCLEVFEHLPDAESRVALRELKALVGERGRIVVGVPLETGLPALFKGLFRMVRRYGEFDATPRNIRAAVFGKPPAPRPVVELLPGRFYHLHHLGFDRDRLARELAAHFEVARTAYSPFRGLGAWCNSEAYYLLAARPGGADGPAPGPDGKYPGSHHG